MTKYEKEQINDKIDYLLKEHNKYVKVVIERYINSGALDLTEYALTKYSLPKVLLTAALECSKDVYEPMAGKYKEDVENLKHF